MKTPRMIFEDIYRLIFLLKNQITLEVIEDYESISKYHEYDRWISGCILELAIDELEVSLMDRESLIDEELLRNFLFLIREYISKNPVVTSSIKILEMVLALAYVSRSEQKYLQKVLEEMIYYVNKNIREMASANGESLMEFHLYNSSKTLERILREKIKKDGLPVLRELFFPYIALKIIKDPLTGFCEEIESIKENISEIFLILSTREEYSKDSEEYYRIMLNFQAFPINYVQLGALTYLAIKRVSGSRNRDFDLEEFARSICNIYNKISNLIFTRKELNTYFEILGKIFCEKL